MTAGYDTTVDRPDTHGCRCEETPSGDPTAGRTDGDDPAVTVALWRTLRPDLCRGLDDRQLHQLITDIRTAAAHGWHDTDDHIALRADVFRGLDDDSYLQRLTELTGRRRQLPPTQ